MAASTEKKNTSVVEPKKPAEAELQKPEPPKIRVLNDHPSGEAGEDSLAISRKVNKAILNLQAEFLDDDGNVNYKGMRDSELFENYKIITGSLKSIDLGSLGETELTALCLNLYNALMIHCILETPGCSKKVSSNFEMFTTMAYQIGEELYTLGDIEHGLLRANRPPPGNGKKPKFGENDPRAKYCVKTVDPRIHFALVCGAKSCPPIKLYSAMNLEWGLDSAAANFVNSEIDVDVETKTVKTNMILHWYTCDFGENLRDMLKWCIPHADEPLKSQLEDLLKLDDLKIEAHEYDWGLNATE